MVALYFLISWLIFLGLIKFVLLLDCLFRDIKAEFLKWQCIYHHEDTGNAWFDVSSHYDSFCRPHHDNGKE